jgi:hypothetical protein
MLFCKLNGFQSGYQYRINKGNFRRHSRQVIDKLAGFYQLQVFLHV